MAEDLVLPYPNLELAQHFFVLSSPSLAHLHDNARKDLLKGIEADRTVFLCSSSYLVLTCSISEKR